MSLTLIHKNNQKWIMLKRPSGFFYLDWTGAPTALGAAATGAGVEAGGGLARAAAGGALGRAAGRGDAAL